MLPENGGCAAISSRELLPLTDQRSPRVFPLPISLLLQNADVMALLRPLLLDTVPSIQQSAALALGRLANYSEALAEAVVMNEVLPQLVYSLSEQNVSTHASSTRT